jgi:hypothetical protein
MFDNESFSHVGGSSPAPRIYTYETTDIRTTVLATGYFNQAYTKLQVKDLIIVNNSVEVYTCKVTAVSKNSVTVAKTSFLDREYAHYYLSQETTLDLDEDGVTYTEVPNMAIGLNRDFTLSDNTLTYTGVGGTFTFNGTSSVSTNKTADVTMSLEINGVVSGVSMLDSHQGGNKRQSTASVGVFQISSGDEFKVLVKGDGQSNLSATFYNMNLVFTEL